MRLATLLLIMALATAAFADPRMWEPTGRVVRGEAPVRFHASAMNAEGLTMLVWIDYESGNGDIWGQLLSSQGAPLWDTGGRRLIQTSEYEDSLRVVAWLDGFMLAFSRKVYPFGAADLFFCPVNLDGAPIWTQNGGTGVVVSHAPQRDWYFKQIVVTGNGSVAYTYEYRASNIYNRIYEYANRVDSSGNVLWETPLTIADSLSNADAFGITADESGGMYASTRRVVDDSVRHSLVKFNIDGNAEWNHDLPQRNFFQRHCIPTYISTEGCYAFWAEQIDETKSFFLQRFSPAGTEIWPEPILVFSDTGYLNLRGMIPSIEQGDTSGVIVLWSLYNAGSNNDSVVTKAQHIRASGELVWPIDGAEVCRSSESESGTSFTGASDHAGGIIYLFEEVEREILQTISNRKLQRIASSGLPVYNENLGIHVGNNFNSPPIPQITVGPADYFVFSSSGYADTNFVRTVLYDKFTGQQLQPVGGRTWAEGLNNNASDVRAIGLSNGNAAVFWMDDRFSSNNPSLYYQIMTSTGALLPDSHGRALFPFLQGASEQYELCSDENGGLFVISKPREEDQYAQTTGTRVRSDGTQVNDGAGVVLAVQGGSLANTNVACAPDGAGGVYFVWQEQQSTPYHVFVQRFDSSLTPMWPNPTAIRSLDWYAELQQVCTGARGECMLLTSQSRNAFVTKILSNGTHAWTTQFCETLGLESTRADFTVDQYGNSIVVWLDRRDNINRNILYAQVVMSDGTERFVHGGIPKVDSVQAYSNLFLVPTATGEPVVVFSSNLLDGEWKTYAMKLNINLQSLWGGLGYHLNDSDEWSLVSATPDLSGGVFFCYGYDYPSEQGLLAVHLGLDGTVTNDYWSGAGGIICSTPRFRQTVAIASGVGSRQAYCFWIQYNGLQSHVYGQYVDETFVNTNPPHAPIVSQITLSQNYPNPFNANTEIVFSLPRAMNAKLRVYDVTGRLVRTLADEQFIAGEHRIAFDARGVASGVYFYELRAGDTKVARKMLLLK